jgi:hypothetical protein
LFRLQPFHRIDTVGMSREFGRAATGLGFGASEFNVAGASGGSRPPCGSCGRGTSTLMTTRLSPGVDRRRLRLGARSHLAVLVGVLDAAASLESSHRHPPFDHAPELAVVCFPALREPFEKVWMPAVELQY